MIIHFLLSCLLFSLFYRKKRENEKKKDKNCRAGLDIKMKLCAPLFGITFYRLHLEGAKKSDLENERLIVGVLGVPYLLKCLIGHSSGLN